MKLKGFKDWQLGVETGDNEQACCVRVCAAREKNAIEIGVCRQRSQLLCGVDLFAHSAEEPVNRISWSTKQPFFDRNTLIHGGIFFGLVSILRYSYKYHQHIRHLHISSDSRESVEEE